MSSPSSVEPLPDLPEAAEREVAPEMVDGVALARLYGEPLFKLPEDLYIPPDALEVFLEAFEGPLDLLLYLIRRQHFNVLDIPMAQLTEQYLAYVEQIRRHNLELAAEYLLMAAMLIEIKSRMLLPVKRAESGDEAEDPRAELVRRLVEYERIKLAAARLDEIPRVGRDFARAVVAIEQAIAVRLPAVDPADLRAAWSEVLRRARLHAHHHIRREELSVREHMSLILKKLSGRQFVEFGDLFDAALLAKGPPIVIVHFLALLELARESLIEITQAAPYAPIYLRLAFTPS
jgi:segregation and condensation protein A